MNIQILDDMDELARRGADLFTEMAEEKAAKGEVLTVALSGGDTPRTLYRVLSSPPYSTRVPWESVHFFFGDERCVGPDECESNFRMAFYTLLSQVDIPEANVHRMEGEGEPEVSAKKYETEIRTFFEARGKLNGNGVTPVFDLVLLGMGDDGHTLSLFPRSKALVEKERLVVENYVDKEKSWRLTFTLPLVNSAALVVFLVSGESKAQVLKNVIEGNIRVVKYPAELVKPARGEVEWLVDKDAAGLLSR
jgi:6-phosphogluconolactonase